MLDAILHLIGINMHDFHFDDNLILCIGSMFVLFTVCYMFNFFQTLMERLTAKKGR